MAEVVGGRFQSCGVASYLERIVLEIRGYECGREWVCVCGAVKSGVCEKSEEYVFFGVDDEWWCVVCFGGE